MKYIVCESKFGIPSAIVFSEALEHKDVAQGHKVLSAGFVTLYLDSAPITHGRSVGLDISSLPGDSVLIEMAIHLKL